MLVERFHSLQTGNTFSELRKSNGKYFPNFTGILVSTRLKFPFPSNGKYFPNLKITIMTTKESIVSIPFKREILSELNKPLSERYESFHSLQTGNTFRNHRNDGTNNALISFHSLQTGNTFRTEVKNDEEFITSEFPFPSNGKYFPNRTPCEPSHSKG